MDPFEIIRDSILGLLLQVEQNTVSADFVLYWVEWLLNRMGQISAALGEEFPQATVTALETIRRQTLTSNATAHETATTATGRPGRPKMDIPASLIERYLEMGISATAVAGIVGVSLRTIRRRMEENDIR